ncbi:PorT family protein [Chitinophagaceae bacterium LB-8]|uniref:PorT family protein n=1 Tax=Paraflavisolibacter caeni TaxID=2982496 RepID=A0A9X2XVW3_9BACT|nr:porin family protein [Paraflavisolibacter caeni]MCU7550339.1 PorT family protein [Paraflavisolibacter caeni]
MKMKASLFVAAATLTISTSLYAQKKDALEPTAQLRVGLNLANISTTDGGSVDKANMLTSFNAGIIGDVPLSSSISLQPGIIFTGKGSQAESGSPSSINYVKETFNPYYIEVPVNLTLKAPIGKATSFYIGAGPYAAMGIGGKNKIEGKTLGASFKGESDIDFSNDDPTTTNQEEDAGFGKLKRFDYGLNGTAGIEGKTIVLGLGYGYGLAKIASGSNSNADDKNKHRVLSFTIGIKL